MSREALENHVTSALEHVTEVLSGETSSHNDQPTFTPHMALHHVQEAMSLAAATVGGGAAANTWKRLRSIDGLIWSAIDDLQTAQRMLERIVEREGF